MKTTENFGSRLQNRIAQLGEGGVAFYKYVIILWEGREQVVTFPFKARHADVLGYIRNQTPDVAGAMPRSRSRHDLAPLHCICRCVGWASPLTTALGRQPTLEVYLSNGRVEIDNNMVENAIRPTALGKKNWLFVDEDDAGERAAIILTLIEKSRRQNKPLNVCDRILLANAPRFG